MAGGAVFVAAMIEAHALDALAAHAPLFSRKVLAPAEAALLGAIAERIWPGARAAGAVTYIEGALAGAYAHDRRRYRTGLARLDAAARRRFGRRFVAAPGEEQDALLRALEAGELPGMPGARGAALFAMLRRHVIEGVLSDPIYGGNRDFAGWRAVGYPGPRRFFTAAEQTSTARLNLPYQGIANL